MPPGQRRVTPRVGETSARSARAYTRPRDEYAPTSPQPDPIDATIAALTRSHAQLLAIDTAYAAELAALPTAALRERAAQLRSDLVNTGSRGLDKQLAALARQREGAERAASAARDRINAIPPHAGHELVAAHATEQQALRRVHALAERERALRATAASQQAEPDLTRTARLVAVREELRRRRATATRATTIDPPAYLVAALGPVPERPSRRRQWHRLAARIDEYRDTHNIHDPHVALGLEPDDLAQRAAWRELRHDLTDVERRLSFTERHHDRSIAD
jgi:hypothetical protein